LRIWGSNAKIRLTNFFNHHAVMLGFIWDHGPKQIVKTGLNVAYWGFKTYARMFNKFSYVHDEKTNARSFSKWRAAGVLAASIGILAGANALAPMGISAAYDAALSPWQRDVNGWVYNSDPVEGHPYNWYVNISDSADISQAHTQVLLLRPNYYKFRFAAGTEEIASKVTVFPQHATVTLTGFRLRFPLLGIDIHPKIQKIHILEPTPLPPASLAPSGGL
jgi:hypothetical protein